MARPTRWRDIHGRKRRPVAGLTKADVPHKPGVYVLYRDGSAVYVGKATWLDERFGGSHLGRGVSMTGSAMRRNVAEFLGIASAADIKARRYKPTLADAGRVADWIRACEVSWVACKSVAAAEALEDRLKAEWKPPLTKL
jgi:hypothetical protein